MDKLLNRLYAYSLENSSLGDFYAHDEEKYEEEGELRERLEKSLSKEQKDDFIRFMDLYSERKYFEDRYTYKFAFREGVRFAMEIFGEDFHL